MAGQSLVTAMAAMRKDEVGADCRLLVEGEEVRVHSQVLATRSPFFRAKFDFPTAVVQEEEQVAKKGRQQVLTENTCTVGATKEITIEGRSAAAVREAVNFMYGIPINKDIYDEASTDYEGLLDIAEFFMMDDFKAEVDKFVTRNIKLTEENFLATSKLADTYRARQLAEGCARFLLASNAETAWDEVERLPVVAAAAAWRARAAVQANRAIVQAVRAAQPCAANNFRCARITCRSANDSGRTTCCLCGYPLTATSTCGVGEMKKVVAKHAEA